MRCWQRQKYQAQQQVPVVSGCLIAPVLANDLLSQQALAIVGIRCSPAELVGLAPAEYRDEEVVLLGPK